MMRLAPSRAVSGRPESTAAGLFDRHPQLMVLLIAKIKHEMFDPRSERSQRLIDQLASPCSRTRHARARSELAAMHRCCGSGANPRRHFERVDLMIPVLVEVA